MAGRVRRAMLTMQRASREPGVAAQALLERGDEIWVDSMYMAPPFLAAAGEHREADENGFVQGVCGAPHSDKPGRATEGQAFFLLMEAAHSRLDGPGSGAVG